MGIILSFEFGSGGGFSLIESIFDLTIFPMLSPILTKLISLDEYKKLAKSARDKHYNLCEDIINHQIQLLKYWQIKYLPDIKNSVLKL